MRLQAPRHSPELVINWHITEACNFACQYCYATWQKPVLHREVFHNPDITKHILQSISDYFLRKKESNPLWKSIHWDAVRLSIAGGEPLLYPDRVVDIAKMSHGLGMGVSLITNGSRLDKALMRELAPHLSMLGVSIDSADREINQRIGRQDRQGRQLSLSGLSEVIDLGRELNPSLKVKINTVVCSENEATSMAAPIQQIGPDKWKVLRVLPVVNDRLSIRRESFQSFVKRHDLASVPVYAEDNEEMVESYIMIDPHGRFFQNRLASGESGHVHSQPIAEVGAACAFESLRFDAQRFAARYVPIRVEGS